MRLNGGRNNGYHRDFTVKDARDPWLAELADFRRADRRGTYSDGAGAPSIAQQREGIRLDAPHQGPTYVNPDRIDLSSILNARSNISIKGPEVSGSQRPIAPPEPPRTEKYIKEQERRIESSIKFTSSVSSTSGIHEKPSFSIGSMSERGIATQKKLDRIYAAIQSFLSYRFRWFVVGTTTDSTLFTAGTPQRWAGAVTPSNFAPTAINSPNSTDSIQMDRYGYMATMTVFTATNPPRLVAFTGEKSTGLFKIEFGFSLRSSVQTTVTVIIEEDDATSIGASTTNNNYWTAQVSIPAVNVIVPVQCSFYWRYLGSSNGLRLVYNPDVNCTLTTYTPRISITKVDE